MSLLDYFRSNKKNSANTAKERLQIIVAHERRKRNSPDYLPQLERDILEVIRKYVDISPEQIAVSLEKRDDELSVLELNVTFPEDKR
ncbi:MAG TPA: cell division topological specificity factor MinE [Rheinheimera sp.]|jgi:cell division topological specificity factor|uniref:Cell division topological specificity factor n=1 Tax=Rheinheimera aquimaris TaxID=412437 RepID=A0ABN1DY14_9GAMM|nr:MULTISPECIES: cell division topological specificity factor MinE [Rheinheimera]MBJ91115.1 cell division topological specificity factor MinE [Alteromonadaceae bacterium]MCB5213713.1 cell division topological specificity factor MinE [Rheinheimera aquimaris]MCD1598104.1 cell division topological specificity factor MinE [Rheinheimera aquimaris]HBN90536.1 cell division topological specificity factor MinE [Rheinheimera sp.]|tara:strand:- start:217 stop:477 length:261 start_codon:yes stop_codon:yes gene_type:complete